MLDQRGHMDGQGKWPRKQTPSSNNNEETVKRLETKPYGKRVNRGHELTFEKYLDGKATGKNMRKPRVPPFRKKDAQAKPQQITKKIKRDGTNQHLNKDNSKLIMNEHGEYINNENHPKGISQASGWNVVDRVDIINADTLEDVYQAPLQANTNLNQG